MRDWFGQRARVSPASTALVDARSGRSVTCDDLDERVETLAGRLAAEGVCVDHHVGLLAESGVDAVAAVHATMRVGACLVPFSTRLTVPELDPRVDRADLDLLLCDESTAERAVDAAGDVPVRSLASVPTVDDGKGDDEERGEHEASGATDERVAPLLAGTEPRPFDLPEWDFDDPLVLLYTSGTTGRPKLVVLTVQNVLASATASAFRLGTLPGDRWASPLAPSSMGGLAPVYRTALSGGAVVLCPTDPEGLLAAMTDHDATGVSVVPTMLRRLLDAGDLPASLRFVLVGGAATPPELVERCVERDVPVCPTYGMTETASQIATAAPGEAAGHPGSVGRPLMFTDVTVVDDHGDPLSAGQAGELVVSGPTVTPGYYGDPEATRAAFECHGLRTGDVGHRDEGGRLYVHNRKDERIVSGGQNVDPGEVAAVLRELPGVSDAVVLGLPDDEWGERVAALVEPESGSESETGSNLEPTDLDAATVEAHCRARLAGYKLPRVVGFATIPRTESGTADRAAVREVLREGGEDDRRDGREDRDADDHDERA
ncbi:class I adenylate-forming enzyme family protein [Halomarina salina]|uniref:Class I adenylate-forming enzyme family protein n=1 Tax=Halomarina salina TaxID=1872699 RepID=A0ABD5RH75_9EURY